MNISKSRYKELLEVKKDYKQIGKNFFAAFVSGGGICLFGQIILTVYEKVFHIEKLDARSLMIGTLVLIAALLSAFGIYDKIGQVMKAGSVVPITGFANSMVSSAMEYGPEGLILGVGANTFKLAGTVITLGVVAAYLFGLIRYIIWVLI